MEDFGVPMAPDWFSRLTESESHLPWYQRNPWQGKGRCRTRTKCDTRAESNRVRKRRAKKGYR